MINYLWQFVLVTLMVLSTPLKFIFGLYYVIMMLLDKEEEA